ncbi:hypothetical protein THAOC_11343 [Thalassiosira oceanica]|uniref:Uncharacterized protein n=1 Tax=Thalassiosira oceanica TaxID=159749 RepID=K0SRK4_THAOC|nr:hypothetical protein THAOC_11343 [Thalassiosira oceanica]|eukprot:EJK67604.1 hypothetical protein THAOC_11343 [Thalassiosira oceanica]
MIGRILQKIPGGQNVQVFVGTVALVGLCAVPGEFPSRGRRGACPKIRKASHTHITTVFAKDTKAGHDLFSQEKPQAIVDSEIKLRKEYNSQSKQE